MSRVEMAVIVESIIGVGGDAETMAFEAKGKLSALSGKYTLSYTEEREGCRIFTTLTFVPGARRVHMKARGDVKYEMVFEAGCDCTTRYEVPPLCLDLTVRSQEVSVSLDEMGGEIRLVYTRVIGGDESPVVYTLRATPREEDV